MEEDMNLTEVEKEGTYLKKRSLQQIEYYQKIIEELQEINNILSRLGSSKVGKVRDQINKYVNIKKQIASLSIPYAEKTVSLSQGTSDNIDNLMRGLSSAIDDFQEIVASLK